MLTGAGMGSVKVLVDVQQDPAVAASVRRRAARDVLEMGMKLRDNADVQERLTAMETRLAQVLGAGPANETPPRYPDDDALDQKEDH